MDVLCDLVPDSVTQPENVLCFPVANLSELDGTKFSDRKRVDGFVWRMMVLRSDSPSSSQSGRSRTLGVYLQRVEEPHSKVQKDDAVVRATITLVNQDNPDKSYSKEFKHTFTSSSTDWGYAPFIKWKDLTSSAKGFLKNNGIIFRADITVLQEPETSTVSVGGSVLSCPSCGEEFKTQGQKQPMSMKCGHTFCFECLESKCCSDSNSIVNLACTVCKQQHTAETKNALWFPNHSVIQMIGNVIPKSKYFCEVHQQNMNYYCFDDNCLVCIGCAFQGPHSKHSCKLVSEAKKDVESRLGLTVKKVVSKSAEISRNLQFLQDEQKALMLQENSLSRVIEESYSQLEEMIKRQKEMQLQELREHMKESEASMESQIRCMKDKCLQVKNALKDFASWQSLTAKDALHSFSDLKSQLEMTVSMSTQLTPAKVKHDTTISFVNPHSQLFSSMIGNLGRLEFRDNFEDNDGSGVESDNSIPPSKKKKLS